MRALITGANGFVGGHLCEHLLDKSGWQLVEMGASRCRATPGCCSKWPSACRPAGYCRCCRDGSRYNARRCVSSGGTGASSNVVSRPCRHPYRQHADAAQSVRGHPGCTAGSGGADRQYRRSVRRCTPGRSSDDEDTPLRPLSPYAVSKVTQDMLAFQYWAAHGLRTIRVRPFNHTGPGQDRRLCSHCVRSADRPHRGGLAGAGGPGRQSQCAA